MTAFFAHCSKIPRIFNSTSQINVHFGVGGVWSVVIYLTESENVQIYSRRSTMEFAKCVAFPRMLMDTVSMTRTSGRNSAKVAKFLNFCTLLGGYNLWKNWSLLPPLNYFTIFFGTPVIIINWAMEHVWLSLYLIGNRYFQIIQPQPPWVKEAEILKKGQKTFKWIIFHSTFLHYHNHHYSDSYFLLFLSKIISGVWNQNGYKVISQRKKKIPKLSLPTKVSFPPSLLPSFFYFIYLSLTEIYGLSFFHSVIEIPDVLESQMNSNVCWFFFFLFLLNFPKMFLF